MFGGLIYGTIKVFVFSFFILLVKTCNSKLVRITIGLLTIGLLSSSVKREVEHVKCKERSRV